jgi:hypothetical protein
VYLKPAAYVAIVASAITTLFFEVYAVCPVVNSGGNTAYASIHPRVKADPTTRRAHQPGNKTSGYQEDVGYQAKNTPKFWSKVSQCGYDVGIEPIDDNIDRSNELAIRQHTSHHVNTHTLGLERMI